MTHAPIRYILLLTVVVRLYHITFPIAGWHSWRQSDTAAIARNFTEEEYNILSPRIDWRGTTPGYVESELHLYPFVTASLYHLFGIHEGIGRGLTVLCSVLTVMGIYRLVKRTIDERTALWSSFFYAILPLSVYYGRAFMPEQTMLMFSVWGIYLFSRWCETPEDTLHYLGAMCCVAAAALVKLPTLYIGLPLAFLAWRRFGWSFIRTPKVILFAVVVFGAVSAWYYHAHQLKAMTGLSFGIWEAGTDKWGEPGIADHREVL